MLNTWIFISIAISVSLIYSVGWSQGKEDQPKKQKNKQIECEIRRILNKNRFQSLKRKGRIK